MTHFFTRQSNLPLASACLLAGLLAGALPARGQATPGNAASSLPAAPPVVITPEEAIRRAEVAEPNYAAAKATSQSAALDRSIARAALLPSARLFNQDIYNQPNGIPSFDGEGAPADAPRFVSYDARPREYIAQGVVEETLGIAGPANLRRADAQAALAAAEQEIARRGLVTATTNLFYGSLAADHKVAVAEQARAEAAAFARVTSEREQAREAAHADVIKAELVEQQRERDLEDARVTAARARLELGVLLFADPRTPYTLQAPESASMLPAKSDVEQAAAQHNPELKSALASLSASQADVTAAWGAMLPTAVLNVTYGIDGNEFATNGPLNSDGTRARNLGYATSVTIGLPVWDWLASQHKVKQSEIRRDAARVALTATQRRLIAQLDEAYSEAQTARDQLASLDLSVNTAAESLRLTKLAYSGGDATVLEVVDAQNAYTAAQNAREDGRVRYEDARATLQTLTGTM